jgi:peptidoglycan/xylan/chitin deacetylase (PgdA/CDA1 family)
MFAVSPPARYDGRRMALLPGKRELLARALGNPLLRPFSRAVLPAGLLTLTYHRVCDYDTLDPDIVSASVDEFKWQIEFLRDNIRILSGDDVLDLLNGKALREPALCITFDDGYADNLRAGQLLRERGVPAIFFVTTGFIGTSTFTLWDRLAYACRSTKEPRLELAARGGKGPWRIEMQPRDLAGRELRTTCFSLPPTEQESFVEAVEIAAKVAAHTSARERPPFMSWDEVRALRDLGHMIGAHTHSHVILSRVPPETQRAEMQKSREVIEREIGTAPRLIAYPNGNADTFSAETKRIAKECGFEGAFSFYGGRNPAAGFDPYELLRVWVSPTESRSLFSARVSFPQLLA